MLFSCLYCRIDHLYAFFLLWNPKHASDSVFHDNHSEGNKNSSSQVHRPPYRMQFKPKESSSQGFVLLKTDDPELANDYSCSDNENTASACNQTTTISSYSDTPPKKQHYLKRQNTLLKEWEVINKYIISFSDSSKKKTK